MTEREGCRVARSRIHERTFSLRFLGIVLKVLRLKVSVYNVYTSFKQLMLRGGGGGDPLVEGTVNSKEETLKTFVSNMSKNSASGLSACCRIFTAAVTRSED